MDKLALPVGYDRQFPPDCDSAGNGYVDHPRQAYWPACSGRRESILAGKPRRSLGCERESGLHTPLTSAPRRAHDDMLCRSVEAPAEAWPAPLRGPPAKTPRWFVDCQTSRHPRTRGIRGRSGAVRQAASRRHPARRGHSSVRSVFQIWRIIFSRRSTVGSERPISTAISSFE